MSDAPGAGRPGDDPEPYVPSGVRRSTYTPPPADTEPPSFDDDALADALAAQVAAYTSPITIVPPPTPEPPSEPTDASAPEPPSFGSPEPAAGADEAPQEGAAAPEPTVEPITGGGSTLEAIERLENELRRRAEEARAETPPPAPVSEAPRDDATPGSPLTDAPPTDSVPFGWGMPAAPFEPASDADPESESESESASGFAPPEGLRFPSPPTYLRAAPPDEPELEPETEVAEAPRAWVIEPEPAPTTGWAEEPAAEVRTEAEEPAPAPGTGFAPPPLVEPPAPVAPAATTPPPPSGFAPPPSAFAPPTFGEPPATPAVDLPPPGSFAPAPDFAHLPPPIGLEPAPLPPYDPTGEVDIPLPTGAPVELPPPPGAFASAPAAAPHPTDLHPDDPHPDDLHPDDLGAGALPPPPGFAPEPTRYPVGEDDVVDDVDRVYTGAIPVDSTGAAAVFAPPSQPIPTQRLADDEPGIVDAVAEQHPALLVETAGPEPTALDLRAGRAARLFWLWFAANSSVITLSLGAVLFGVGMSLRQALVAILVGVALSFLPLGLVTLAGKWSGQPTMIVSRATFGVTGNVLPTILAVLSRVFWGGALLWMLAAGVGRVLADAGLDAGLGEQVWTLVALGVGFALAFAVAIFGYGLLARLQLVLSIVTGLLVVGLIALTADRLDISAAQGVADGPWMLLVTGVVLVFSFVGLAWVHSSADVARYQRPDGDGGSTMLWSTFGATLPAFVLLAWGAMLAASDPVIADGLATNPLHTIAALLPVWYPAPLLAAIALGLLSGVVLTVYSGGFALQALGVPMRRSVTTAIAGALVLVAAVVLVLLVGDARGLIRDVATTIAVPIAAWAGIFATEMMIRRRRFHAESLLRGGGVYPAVRWANLVGLVVITVLGLGLTAGELPWLAWQGYLLPVFGLAEGDPLLTSDVGVLVALVLGILLPLVSAIPAIRRQEEASVD